MYKATIIEPNGKDKAYHYIDKEGNELHDGDFIRWDSGKIEKLYLTDKGRLGTDATNPLWVANGRAVECEYGIYPLDYGDMKEIVKA